MMYSLYAVSDAVSSFFASPFMANSDDDAIRSFKCDYDRALNQAPSSPFAMFPGDFNLYRVGSFDACSGLLVSVPVPALILSGRSLLRSDDK